MKSENFVYWLQGFFELTDTEELTKEQVKMIKEHLQLVFDKQTSTLEELKTNEGTIKTPFISPQPSDKYINPYINPWRKDDTGGTWPTFPYITCKDDSNHTKAIC